MVCHVHVSLPCSRCNLPCHGARVCGFHVQVSDVVQQDAVRRSVASASAMASKSANSSSRKLCTHSSTQQHMETLGLPGQGAACAGGEAAGGVERAAEAGGDGQRQEGEVCRVVLGDGCGWRKMAAGPGFEAGAAPGSVACCLRVEGERLSSFAWRPVPV